MVEFNGQPKIGDDHFNTDEGGIHDADHSERAAAHRDRTANGFGVLGEEATPARVTQDHDRITGVDGEGLAESR